MSGCASNCRKPDGSVRDTCKIEGQGRAALVTNGRRKVKGKTVSVALSQEQYQWLAEAIANWRKLQDIPERNANVQSPGDILYAAKSQASQAAW